MKKRTDNQANSRSGKPIRVALAGFGTVGTGVARVLIERGQALQARTGLSFVITGALDKDPDRPRDITLPDGTLVTSPDALFAAPLPDVLVEVIGGTTTSREVALRALRAGVPVVTANKALLAMHGRELFAAARASGTCVAFEASCAGGVPVVAALQHALIASRIDALYGILNGTCNYILSEMLEQAKSYDEALRDAQRLGYAEADPTLDVDGTDSAHKLAILASLAFGADVAFDQIDVTGIQDLTVPDLRIAQRLGYVCKLLAIGRRTDAGLSLRVHPSLVPASHPLARAEGSHAAVLFRGDAMDQLFLSGNGAGSLPTAGAIVSDLVDLACGNAQRTFNQLRIFNDQNAPPAYVAPGDAEYRYYLRYELGRPTSPGETEEVLAKHRVQIERHEPAELLEEGSEPTGTRVLVTRPAREDDLVSAAAELARLGDWAAQPVLIRVVELA